MNAPLYFADDYFTFDFALQTLNETQNIHIIDKKNKVKLNLDLDLLGHYQHKNILTTLTALAKLKHKFSLTDDKIIAALSNVMNLTGLMGRWQIIDQNPLTVCDTGHNAEGIAEIVQQIFKYPFKQLHIVFGVVDDKSTDKVFKLLPHDAIYYFTKASIPRALDEKILKQRANDAGLNGESYSNVQQAYLAAKENAELHDFVFIGGSTFIVADLLSYLQECN
jgi:dihydrofolate synthase/folylpolyglutamate synthase